MVHDHCQWNPAHGRYHILLLEGLIISGTYVLKVLNIFYAQIYHEVKYFGFFSSRRLNEDQMEEGGEQARDVGLIKLGVAIISLFLVCHFLRLFLNISEVFSLSISRLFECAAEGKASFTTLDFVLTTFS